MHTSIHLADFAPDAAKHILEKGRVIIDERRLFRLGLAGGDTPRAVYAEMAKLGSDFPWSRTQITFGDERCVPPDDKDSNFGMARDSLLGHVAIPAGNVFRMRGEIDPAAAAEEYEAQLGTLANRLGESRYVHDILLLGLGPDGHTASLFPGAASLDEAERNILPVIGSKPPPQRLTMTFPLINAAREIIFLVKDGSKAAVVADVQAGDARYPAARVPAATWLLGF